LTIGRHLVTDIFDNNNYKDDPGKDFLNWAVVDAGAFDLAPTA
jgi:high affinity Mn2+ porin